MKRLHKLFAIALLTFVLTQAALAGDGTIHGDFTPTPTPTPTVTPLGGGEASGDGTTDGTGAETGTANIAIEVALSYLNVMFTI
jgi:hypothetical protein